MSINSGNQHFTSSLGKAHCNGDETLLLSYETSRKYDLCSIMLVIPLWVFTSVSQKHHLK